MSGVQKEKEPLRVLHVFGRLNLGGAESRTVELYRAMDRNQVQFDFLVHTDAKGVDTSSDALMKARAPEHFDKTVRELGARIFAVPRFRGSNIFMYKKALRRLFEEHRGEWAAVHGHMTSTAAIYLKIAGESGVPLLIAHARNAGVDPGLKGVVTNLLRRPLRKKDCPYYRLAVSAGAGEDVFGRDNMNNGNVYVIPNALHLSGYAYDSGNRERIRASLGVKDEILLGHVGRFHYQKNHDFLIRVFAACVKKALRSEERTPRRFRLLLIGEGERMSEIKALATEQGVGEDVIFAGKRSGMAAYYSAMDCFVFPSHYEGMPGAVLEAQAAGLPCLISDRITKETDMTKLVKRMSLHESPETWAEMILSLCQHAGEQRDDRRTAASEEARCLLSERGFGTGRQAERMMYFYRNGIIPDSNDEGQAV